MFEDIIKALASISLEEGETIGLKELCNKTGLRLGMWADRLGSPSTGFLINMELAKAGFKYSMSRGRYKTFTFQRITPQ